ncbi:MAG: carbohydrate binding family 9 domain-containing protein [Parafilimonas sp.]|nr:carbohydrate binding family 9 domain-containing protein [Parafilimonas sp.]
MFSRKLPVILSAILFTHFNAFTQKKNACFQVHIHKASSPIIIDGIVNEQAWQDAEPANNFFMVLPMDTSLAHVKTDVRVTYDDKYFYLLAICYKAVGQRNMVESLRRDFSFVKNDNFLVFIDPFEDQTTGYSFGANAEGAQWDGSMYAGGSVDLNWDNKWISAVKNYDDKYIFEAAIPFKTLRYKKDVLHWGINFSRNDLKTTEKSSWAPVPRQFPTASLAYTGTLIWDAAPPDPSSNISLIPYFLTNTSKDYINKTSPGIQGRAGIDAKISFSTSLNLDLTIHPDFSQVEVDQQLINLSRYELFFPEKRQFFLENGDLFGNFGYADIRPFFSRRIGLNMPINIGARLSGKLNKNLRIGAMDMETGANDEGLPSQNYAVISLQQKVFKRSNIAFIYIDKTAVDYHPPKDSSISNYNAYNRNIGVEYNLASANNVITGKTLFLKSFTEGKSNNDFVQASNIQYSSRRWLAYAQYEYVGKNYVADVGYVPRKNFIKLNPQLTRYFFPKSGIILTHGPQLTMNYFFDTKMNETDHENILAYLFTFRSKATFSVLGQDDYVKLLQPFDPTNTGKDSLPALSVHHYNLTGFDYISAPQHIFTYTASLRYGSYYDGGNIFTATINPGYRIQPYLNMSFNTTYTDLMLPQPWGNTHFWLIGPRIDVTFTNTVFFTTYIQYNQQQHNININARFQWRFKPASDLFVVYTDNYYPAPLFAKTRAFVIKLNYWWNL